MEYRVLARKYRPTNFDDLIGQEVLVRTLSNAIASGRVAHAFLLTGIRGIGKTTTARIIARALNCQQGPTISPCGVCSQCVGIGEDRNVDVMEMDAASHTGVGDIRDLIETVRYMPSSARYKIYIIDEVHMLSTSAFNALLKTLEEPPPHVKFIFATTEIRKIPVTILSRCQRFDLKRISTEMLAKHLQKICDKEQVQAEYEALTLIANAAEGSVRDALSLLDQAMARANPVTQEDVRAMIGASDHAAQFELLEALTRGDISAALSQTQARYVAGADPLMITQEAMELVHLITRIKVNPEASSDISLSEQDRKRAMESAQSLSMAVLARLWQMFLKGLGEVRQAPSAMAALEMLLIRIAYAAALPTPAEIIGTTDSASAAPPIQAPVVVSRPVELKAVAAMEKLESFADMVALFEKRKEALIYVTLKDQARLVSFEQGKVVLNMAQAVSRDFSHQVAEHLKRWTGENWQIILSDDAGDLSLHEQELAHKETRKQEALKQPLVASVLDQFPGAKIVGVK